MGYSFHSLFHYEISEITSKGNKYAEIQTDKVKGQGTSSEASISHSQGKSPSAKGLSYIDWCSW